jgi:hypothetical protein
MRTTYTARIRSVSKIASEICELESTLQEVYFLPQPMLNVKLNMEDIRGIIMRRMQMIAKIGELETEINELLQKQRRLKHRSNRIKKRNIKKAKRER